MAGLPIPHSELETPFYNDSGHYDLINYLVKFIPEYCHLT